MNPNVANEALLLRVSDCRQPEASHKYLSLAIVSLGIPERRGALQGY